MKLKCFHFLFLLLALPVGAMAGAPANAASQNAANAATPIDISVPSACDVPFAKTGIWNGTKDYLHSLAKRNDFPYAPRLRSIVLIQHGDKHYEEDGQPVLDCPIVAYVGHRVIIIFSFRFIGAMSGDLMGTSIKRVTEGIVPHGQWRRSVTNRQNCLRGDPRLC